MASEPQRQRTPPRHLDAPVVPESVAPGTILTLRDVPVIPVNHVTLRSTRKPALLSTALESDSDEWDADVLEDATSRVTNSTSKPKITTQYDPTDSAQFVDDAPRHQKTTAAGTKITAQSVERPNSLAFESDYHQPPVASIPKRERRLRKKRRRERSSSIATDSTVSAAPISRGHVDALRKATDDRENQRRVGFKNDPENVGSDSHNDDGEEGESDDGHYNALLRSRKRTQQASVHSSVNKIFKAIRDANEDDLQNDVQDSVYERGAKVLSNEMHYFLQEGVLRSTAGDTDVPMSDHVDEPEAGNEVVESDKKGIKLENRDGATDTVAASLEQSREKQDSLGRPESGNAGSVKKEEVFDSGSATNGFETGAVEKSDKVEEVTGLTGLAGTLKRLREMGQLTKKKEQVGRARDRRLHSLDDSDEDDSNDEELQKKNVELSYLDEFGNELTPKEAFRMLCHKFHGNAPGKNKNEKRLKKMLERMRVRNMRIDDTPLASAAALKEETRKLGTPHIVVSGAEGFTNGTAANETSKAGLAESDDVRKHIEEPKVEFTIGWTKNPSKRRRLQSTE